MDGSIGAPESDWVEPTRILLTRRHDERVALGVDANGKTFEWEEIKGDLSALREVALEMDGERFSLRSELRGCWREAFTKRPGYRPRSECDVKEPVSTGTGYPWWQDFIPCP